jgi:hypothetical protein
MTGRPYAARAAKFLRDVLAGGPLRVPELDRLAREAGLLDERQHITHAKLTATLPPTSTGPRRTSRDV